MAIDAGTTGVRSIAVAEDGRILGTRYREFPQHFPRPGWVEHDPDDIWAAVVSTLGDLTAAIGQPIAAIGLTNQRETTLLWDRRSGRPLHRAIVWQDRRSAAICEEMSAHLGEVRLRTGLVLDSYFSATKLAWLFKTGAVEIDAGTVFGTVDSWLLWKLTSGGVHATDVTNASRTLLFDINELSWNADLAGLFGVPMSILPEVCPSSGRVAKTAGDVIPGIAEGLPVSGVAGDQQAALFGQACFEAGMAKNTYGTGSFVLMNIGSEVPPPVEGLLTTVAWSIADVSPQSTSYALEGAIFVTGAAIQWLRDGLGIISEASDTGPLAESVTDSGGVVFVPALTGLGSPWWDPHARGTVLGITRGTTPAHLARATVEAMCFQTADAVEAMEVASGRRLRELRIDGGASVMEVLLRLQADVLGVPCRRAAVTETTALGAAFLAGLAEGVWGSLDELAGIWSSDAVVEPAGPGPGREAWKRAVERAGGWDF